mgnify:CR=1 FL=1
MVGYLEAVATYLNSKGVVAYPATAVATWPCFIHSWAATPDAVVCLYPRPGRESIDAFGGKRIRSPEMHIEVRGSPQGTPAAFNKMCEIGDALHNVGGITVNGIDIIVIRALGEVSNLGRDDKNRSIFSQNFVVKILC